MPGHRFLALSSGRAWPRAPCDERIARRPSNDDETMPAAHTRRLCRIGLLALSLTALCVLTLLDAPPRPPYPPVDPPPTPGGEPPGTRSIVAYSWARRLALDYRPSRECGEGNGTAVTSGTSGTSVNASGPNNGGDDDDEDDDVVGNDWLETIEGRLFLYSAHLDLRVEGYPSLRVIGVKRGPLATSSLFCTVWYYEENKIRSLSIEALISPIWLDEWGGRADSYIGILMSCQLPTESSIKPWRVHVGEGPCHENPSHSLAINGRLDGQRSVGDKPRFTLCIKGLDFDEDISEKLVAFVEFHRILGAGFFYFYVFNVHANVLKVLRLYERSNVVRWYNLSLPGDLPNEKSSRRHFLGQDVWTKRRMELIPYNHCFYESLGRAEFVVPIDVDETIVPVRRSNWANLLLAERRKLGGSFKDFASYAVRNAYFFPELQNRSQTGRGVTANDPSAPSIADPDYLDVVRSASISPEGDSVKSFVSTRRALTVHNHYALTTLSPLTRRAHHLDPKDALKHHHRSCDDNHIDCNLLMEDTRVDQSAMRYANELRARIKIALADLKALRTG